MIQKHTLETLINHRKLVEDNHHKELVVLRKALAKEEECLWDLKRGRDNLIRELKERQQEGLSSSDINLYVCFIQQLSKRFEEQRARVLEAERKVEQKRQQLVAAMKERRIAEKLKEKILRRVGQEMAKREQELLNEVGIHRFVRTTEI